MSECIQTSPFVVRADGCNIQALQKHSQEADAYNKSLHLYHLLN